MSLPTCPSPEVLTAFALGDLPESMIEEIARHLDECSTCDEAVARLDVADEELLAEIRRCAHLATPAGPATTEVPDAVAPRGAPEPGEDWGEFRIVRELGRGGMGVVYEAYQGSLRRHVAVKLLPETGNLARFRREARAAGRLHHTNIVPVFGVGEHRGRPFYVMQYIAGRGLHLMLVPRAADGGRLQGREAARIALQAAGALDYAHRQGVVHRDVKPSNLLIDERGTVWVADFGLALDAVDSQTLTESGDLIGTLQYMPPERLSGRGDARSDVYGLGATLYELVCGRPPLEKTTTAEMIHQLLRQDPIPPRQLAPELDRDLETIILKAIARDPDQRYATAGDLAEDLRRFLDGRTILARRTTSWERTVRWCRRNPDLASAFALSALAMLATAAIAVAFAAYQSHNAEQQRRAAQEQGKLRKTAEDSLARVALREGVSLCEKSEVGHGLLWLTRALRSAPEDDVELLQEIRHQIDRWRYLAPHLRDARVFDRRVNAVAISPDGTRAIAGSDDGSAQLWELASGRLIGSPLRPGGAVRAVAFSPDRRLVLTSSGTAQVQRWDAASGAAAGRVLEDPGGSIDHLAVSPDGRHLATGGPRRSPRLWDLATGHAVTLRRDPEPAASAPSTLRWLVRFTPDGKRVLAVRTDWTMKEKAVSQFWDVGTGEPIGSPIQHDSAAVWAADFDRDGRRMLIADGSSAWLFDVESGARRAGPFNHLDAVFSAAFSPDGKSFATGSGDGIAAIWSPERLDQRSAVLSHPQRSQIFKTDFRPDGRRLLTASDDGVVRLWDPAGGRPLGGPCLNPAKLNGAAVDPNGRWIVTGGEDGVARVWETPTSVSLLPPMSRANKGIRSLAFSPVGSILLTGNDGGDLACWDAHTAEPIGRPLSTPGQVLSVAFSPDGKMFATAGRHQPIRLYQRTGQPLRELDGTAATTGLAFRPTDGSLLAGGEDGKARLWDPIKGDRIGPSMDHGAAIHAVAISPDGRLAVTGGQDGRALLWRLGEASPAGTLMHDAPVLDVAFDREGSAILTGCGGGKARLWSRDRQLLIREFDLGRKVPVHAVAAAPDGRTVAAGGADRSFHLWDAATGQLLLLRDERHSGLVLDLSYRPDGKAIAIGLGDGTTELVDVAYPIEGSAEELILWSQVISNASLDARGNLKPLDDPAWRQLRDELLRRTGRSSEVR